MKGLKFNEVQYFLKRKIPIPCKRKIANQNLWGYNISASSQLPTLHFLPGASVSDYHLTYPPTHAPRGVWKIVSEASQGILVLRGSGGVFLRPQPSHTLGKQIDSTFLPFFFFFLRFWVKVRAPRASSSV